MGSSALPFIPYAGLIALAVPESMYPDTEAPMTKEAWMEELEKKAPEIVTGELVVAGIGSGVSFVKVGDVVSLQSHVRVQRIEIDGDKPDNPKLVWIVRESEILVKHDKAKDGE